MKKIGVLTSGGDAPGMNAVVRSVVRTAISKGMEAVGIMYGYNGLIDGELIPMDRNSVSDIINRGGTFLYTARSPRFKDADGVQAGVKTCIDNGIEGMVIIGGDGSFRGARDLSNAGIPCVGIPTTIDNDIACTDYTIGFDTSVNTAVEMIDKIRDTAQSHDRCSVVEVMGRSAGHIALQTGIAVGATAILVPEETPDVKKIISKIEAAKANGKRHFIIVVAEGVKNKAPEIAKLIELATGIDSRATILGHVQRGGSPTVRDRVTATKMGYAAVELLSKGIGNRVICEVDNKIIDRDIFEALNMHKGLDLELFHIADMTSN